MIQLVEIQNSDVDIDVSITPEVRTYNIVLGFMSDTARPYRVAQHVMIWLDLTGFLGELEAIYPPIMHSSPCHHRKELARKTGFPRFEISACDNEGMIQPLDDGFIVWLAKGKLRNYGSIVDPLFVYSTDMAITMVTEQRRIGIWDNNSKLSIAPDNYHKYGYSGSGAYSINLPCRAIDAPLLLERHNTTFINYLRVCFQWGGFPGLEIENRLSDEDLHFLTESFLQF